MSGMPWVMSGLGGPTQEDTIAFVGAVFHATIVATFAIKGQRLVSGSDLNDSQRAVILEKARAELMAAFDHYVDATRRQK